MFLFQMKACIISHIIFINELSVNQINTYDKEIISITKYKLFKSWFMIPRFIEVYHECTKKSSMTFKNIQGNYDKNTFKWDFINKRTIQITYYNKHNSFNKFWSKIYKSSQHKHKKSATGIFHKTELIDLVILRIDGLPIKFSIRKHLRNWLSSKY